MGVCGSPSIDDAAALADFAERALYLGEEADAVPLLKAGAKQHRSALLWQWAALLQRSLDEHEDALGSFDQAVRLAPKDARIAQGMAQTAMEAGLNAVGLFERARLLAPADGAILIGLVAARNAVGDGEAAASDLAHVVDRAPLWTYGHEQLAQLLSLLGRPEASTSSIESALGRFPSSVELWRTLLQVQLRQRDFQSLKQTVERAVSGGVHSPDFDFYLAVHASELSDEAFPSILFEGARPQMASALAAWRVRHLLRVGALEAATAIIDEELRGPQSEVLWPYAATAWRLSGDPRLDWLEGSPALVQTYDLSGALPSLDELAIKLRSLHLAKGEFLDQSVRGGTQTDGPLLSRIDPVIRQVRSAIVGAVGAYLEQLPPIDPQHPLLRHARDRRVRFSGSWSVRLRSGGRHSNHVHPQGWISSALYVSLPPKHSEERADAGWLSLGQPDEELELGLAPKRQIEPTSGQLTLFPSWMWHGTVPFSEGERLTIAFDVRPPI